jgi:L-methionine (R)-S-oxide reductase
MMNEKKKARYNRIYQQLKELLRNSPGEIARMATVAAVLHHKMDGFFWTGYYLLQDDKLVVGPYQGPLACQELEKNLGVCWAAINNQKTIIVQDVKEFPGHIACDPRSRSEIAIPLINKQLKIVGILDIDSKKPGHFDETDERNLIKIAGLIFPD